jgi:hypothetical protein
MKVNLDDDVARQLIDRLKDEQPGTQLAEFRERVQRTMPAVMAKRRLSSDELELTVAILEAEEAKLKQDPNPTRWHREKMATLSSALTKLIVMAQRQAALTGSEP